MRELSKATGHSRPYLRQQLRKFDIRSERDRPGLAPFGWDCVSNQLVKNEKEQSVLGDILRLKTAGKGIKAIAAALNRGNVPSKTGGRWWPSSVKNILRREMRDDGI